MSKSIFITNGDQEINQSIARHLLSKGHRVGLYMPDRVQADAYRDSLESGQSEHIQLFGGSQTDEESVAFLMEEAILKLDGLDALIHGNEMLDEEKLLVEFPEQLGETISSKFRQIFLWNRAAVGYLMKQKSGKILFPVVYDSLYYDNYPSSPMMNHGKISLMKCLSRECSAFRIDVNVITFGYHDIGSDQVQKKEMKKGLEIFGLKPQLKQLDEMLDTLEMLIVMSSSLIGGQNIELGVGIETQL